MGVLLFELLGVQIPEGSVQCKVREDLHLFLGLACLNIFLCFIVFY